MRRRDEATGHVTMDRCVYDAEVAAQRERCHSRSGAWEASWRPPRPWTARCSTGCGGAPPRKSWRPRRAVEQRVRGGACVTRAIAGGAATRAVRGGAKGRRRPVRIVRRERSVRVGAEDGSVPDKDALLRAALVHGPASGQSPGRPETTASATRRPNGKRRRRRSGPRAQQPRARRPLSECTGTPNVRYLLFCLNVQLLHTAAVAVLVLNLCPDGARVEFVVTPCRRTCFPHQVARHSAGVASVTHAPRSWPRRRSRATGMVIEDGAAQRRVGPPPRFARAAAASASPATAATFRSRRSPRRARARRARRPRRAGARPAPCRTEDPAQAAPPARRARAVGGAALFVFASRTRSSSARLPNRSRFPFPESRRSSPATAALASRLHRAPRLGRRLDHLGVRARARLRAQEPLVPQLAVDDVVQRRPGGRRELVRDPLDGVVVALRRPANPEALQALLRLPLRTRRPA